MKKNYYLAVLLSCLFWAATSSFKNSDEDRLSFKDANEDTSNFYINKLTDPIIGDPFFLYDEDEKVFYMYGTTGKSILRDKIYDNFEIYACNDLKSWEKVATVFDDETVRINSWMKPGIYNSGARFWAPEVHKFGDYYYIYFTAADRENKLRNSVAWAKSPKGPFYTDFTSEFADEIAKYTPNNKERYDGKAYIFDTDNVALPNDNDWVAIDGTIFRDEDGQFYYYLTRDQQTHPDGEHKSTVWGCKMLNPFIRDPQSKFVQLTDVARSVVGGEKDQEWEVKTGAWNEGPFVIKHDNKYYMTYSANYFGSEYYSIGHAVSDNPLSGFVKPKEGALVMGLGDGTAADWDYFSGTGHHMFLNVGSQSYAVYHKHRENDKLRVAAIDSYGFREDGSLYINGPTINQQPLPEAISEYRNIINEAIISIDNRPSSNMLLLTDGALGLQKSASKYEAKFEGGKTIITLTFAKTMIVHGIMIYNSAVFDERLEKVEKIEFDGGKYIENVTMGAEMMKLHGDTPYMVAGSNINAILEEDVETKSIRISIDSKAKFALSEICVLGK